VISPIEKLFSKLLLNKMFLLNICFSDILAVFGYPFSGKQHQNLFTCEIVPLQKCFDFFDKTCSLLNFQRCFLLSFWNMTQLCVNMFLCRRIFWFISHNSHFLFIFGTFKMYWHQTTNGFLPLLRTIYSFISQKQGLIKFLDGYFNI